MSFVLTGFIKIKHDLQGVEFLLYYASKILKK